MTTLAEVRDGLVEALSNGLPADVSVNRLPVDSTDFPAVIVAGIQGQPSVMGVGQTLTVDLFVVVSRRSVDEVDRLDSLLDETQPDSVPAVIHADPSLGDRVVSARVVNFGEYREMEVGTPVYAATVIVEVLT